MSEANKPSMWFEYLEYLPERGEFLWKKKPSNRVTVGSVAGPVKRGGYREIRLKGKRLAVHRLVWLFETGTLSDNKMRIDHINGNILDNRFCNLRLVSPARNIRHRIEPRGQIKYHGVCRHRNGFYSQITYNYQKIYIGIFKTAIEAARARDRKAIELWGSEWMLESREALAAYQESKK